MKAQNIKTLLHESIENINDEDFLQAVKQILDRKYTPSDTPKLTKAQIKRIEESKEQIRNGKFLTNTEADKLVKVAKRIKWSTHAVADRISILDYWYQRIGNKKYSKKLDQSLKEIIKIIAQYPKLGRQLNTREERFFVKDSYQIFYIETNDSIELIHIWDSRRNPDDLSL